MVPVQKHVKGAQALCEARQGVKGCVEGLINFGSVLPFHGSPVNHEFNKIYSMVAVS